MGYPLGARRDLITATRWFPPPSLFSVGASLPASTVAGPFDTGSPNHFIETDVGGGQQSLAVRFFDANNGVFLTLGTGTGNNAYTMSRKTGGANGVLGGTAVNMGGPVTQLGDRLRLEARGSLVRMVLIRAGVVLFTSPDLESFNFFGTAQTNFVGKFADGNSVSNNVTYGAL